MPAIIGREEVRIRLGEGATLLDVLPREQYEDEHIAGAINIPLRELDELAPRELDPDRPIITYCWDYQ